MHTTGTAGGYDCDRKALQSSPPAGVESGKIIFSGGVDVKTVQEVLGHENLNTTQIYTHIESTELKIAAEANPISKLNFSKSPKE